jgi:hypothetical protein
MTDLPMLEEVGHPVVVNPDRELARIARERGWEVRQFRIGVPLRERVSMPPPRLTAAVAATTVATAAGAGALWWWWLRKPPAVAPPSRVARARSALSVRSPAASSPQRQRARPRR